MVGDPHQAQPVAAGGLAHWMAAAISRTRDSPPVAEPEINRRQADPVERHALGCFRDRGRHRQPDTTQTTPAGSTTTATAAQAIAGHGRRRTADIDRPRPRAGGGAGSHPRRLRSTSPTASAPISPTRAIAGPVIDGPGLGRAPPLPGRRPDPATRPPAPHLDDGSRLTNGTVATVIAVSPPASPSVHRQPDQTVTAPRRLCKATAPTAAPSCRTPGLAPSTGCRAAPGRRSTFSPPRPSTATAAMWASPAPSTHPHLEHHPQPRRRPRRTIRDRHRHPRRAVRRRPGPSPTQDLRRP